MALMARLLMVIGLVCMTGTAAADESLGAIRGKVNYCGAGGLDGMQIYVPGRPYLVITAENGEFQLDRLPAGEYSLYYRAQDHLLNRAQGITVAAGQVTDLGVVAFCKKKQVAAQQPTATAQDCLAQDGNLPAIVVAHGIGTCKDGKVTVKSCNKWYGDCDGKPSNGCETDLKHDDKNCGSCGNECEYGEICALGFC